MNQQTITVNNQSVPENGQSWVMLLEGMDMTCYYKRVVDNVERTNDKISKKYLDSSMARVAIPVTMNVKRLSKRYGINNSTSQDRTQSSAKAQTSSKDNKSRSKSSESEKQKGNRIQATLLCTCTIDRVCELGCIYSNLTDFCANLSKQCLLLMFCNKLDFKSSNLIPPYQVRNLC